MSDIKEILNLVPLNKDFGYLPPKNMVDLMKVLIHQRGIPIIYTHSTTCPCYDTDSFGGKGVPKPNCISCGGLGLYFAEDHSVEFRALVSGGTTAEARNPEGITISGTIDVVIPSEVTVAEGDRIVLKDVHVPIKFMRRYDASTRGMRLPFKPKDVEILVTKYEDPKEQVIVLKKGKDFVVNMDTNTLYFPIGSKVTDKMVVSGEILASPYFIVESIPAAGRGLMSSTEKDAEYVSLPRRVSAVRADLLLGMNEKFVKDVVNEV